MLIFFSLQWNNFFYKSISRIYFICWDVVNNWIIFVMLKPEAISFIVCIESPNFVYLTNVYTPYISLYILYLHISTFYSVLSLHIIFTYLYIFHLHSYASDIYISIHFIVPVRMTSRILVVRFIYPCEFRNCKLCIGATSKLY